MLIAYIEQIKSDLDAFDIYSLFRDTKEPVILDSGMNNNNLGKYSIIGINPVHNFTFYKGLCYLDGIAYEGDVFEELNKFINKYEIKNEVELSFVGGAIGYLGYDLCRSIENIQGNAVDIVDIPSCYFNIYDNYIVYNHESKIINIIALGLTKDKESSIQNIKKRIEEGEKVEYSFVEEDNIQFKSPFTKESYMAAISQIREYIKKGHIYITNMTHTFTCDINKDPYSTYKALRHINPAPFAAYMPFNGFSILSSSPERFLQLKNRKVQTRPIKGTRPRGNNDIEDEINKKELINSEKDKSELLMIVDLERNDLSKVCKPHTVKVTELFELEKYPTVFHLVSTVIGELEPEYNQVDLIKATFPGGSITGAPKIRSMEIIDEIEPTRRNIYTGSIGYIGFDGSMDLNIVIRTILMKDQKAFIGVGGGITWESNEEEEYFETLAKAKALFKSLRLSPN